MKDVPDDRQTVQDFFEAKLKPVMQTNGGIECGKLQRATVVLQGESGEIEVDELSDEAASAAMYLHMGLSKVIFYVEQAVSESCRASERNVGDALVRQEPQALPIGRTKEGQRSQHSTSKTLSDLLRKGADGTAGCCSSASSARRLAGRTLSCSMVAASACSTSSSVVGCTAGS
eukprot:CAMPEP_0182836060 /NCGR_PEP_ID=MMETSP0006_2-20121128/21874_1 /TAXON_ID=97485 /ORGANISM="Prymnesium parvum, Strain Texoma1" /LENGTH=173 /DNA_ID=CAMNT_0024964603 /DNA_START=30 /DNA_END=548 /DNA_ORIENTATION=+